MLIRETSVFTRQVQKLLDDESYRLLQLHLVENPEAGTPIRGNRRAPQDPLARKRPGQARGATAQHVVLMLLMYRKKDRDDLSPEQRTILKRVVEEEFHG